jgi:hypothetical protein
MVVERQQGAIKFNCTLLFRLIAPLYFIIYQPFKPISAIGAIKIRKKTLGREREIE